MTYTTVPGLPGLRTTASALNARLWRHGGDFGFHITYSRNINFKLVGFCDVSYGTGNSEKARPTSGSMYFISTGVIHASTNIQKRAAQSTARAKLIAMSSCAKQRIYLYGVLGKLRWMTFCSGRILCDNKGALLVTRSGTGQLQRSKYLPYDQVSGAARLDHRQEARHRPRLNQGPAERHSHQVFGATHLHRAAQRHYPQSLIAELSVAAMHQPRRLTFLLGAASTFRGVTFG